MTYKDINILIVDDRPENLLVLEGLLEDMPCQIIKATSGNEALALMLEYEFALVLLDVQMPEMDGFETAVLMRGSERTRGLPIIFVTAIYKEQSFIFKGYEIGAVDYLFKPIEPIILRSKVQTFLELYQQKSLLQEQAENLRLKYQELLDLQESNRRLQVLSNVDGLTKISNRRSFDEYLSICWEESVRNRIPLSLIMIDIDFFKTYNDHYGHLQGDDCLITVAQRLRSSVKRPMDFVARYGGEEFAIILPETDMEGAMTMAETIRENVQELSIPHEYSSVSSCVSVSLGVYSSIADENKTYTDFITNADAALYLAKQSGRNRVGRQR